MSDFQLLVIFIIKHWIADFPLQMSPYINANKHIWMHPGALLHAAIHAFLTLLILCYCLVPVQYVLSICVVEFVLHYLLDYAAKKTNELNGYTPTNGPGFYQVMGFDQLMHYLSYVWIISYLNANGALKSILN
jgi:hypothetical protein